MSWRALAVLAVPCAVAALLVESLVVSIGFAVVAVVLASLGVAIPMLAEWRARQPAPAPPLEKREPRK